MSARPLTVAIEGPSCSGKTTLGRNLERRMATQRAVVYVEDYADFVGGGRFLPPEKPGSVEEERLILSRYLELEAGRTAKVHLGGDEPSLVLVDRSVHTLLAHCRALLHVTGIDYYTVAQRIVGASDSPLWPQVLLYLDASQEVIRLRNWGKYLPGSLLIDASFNLGIRSYFEQLAISSEESRPRVVWLEASLDGGQLLETAHMQVMGALEAKSSAEEAF